MSLSIKQESKIVGRHSLIYGVGNLLNNIVAFIMLPIYTRFLTPSDYGTLELITLTTEIAGIVVAMGMNSAVYRFYFEYDDLADRNEILSTAILSFSSISLGLVVLLSTSAPILSQILFETEDFSYYFVVAFASLWVGTIAQIGFLYLRIIKKSGRFLIFSLIKLLIALSLNIYFVVWLRTGVIGILYASLVSSAIIAFVLVGTLLMRIRFRFSRDKCWEMFRFGIPLIPSALGNLVVLTSDRFFIRYLVSIADTGIYSLACRFSVIPARFITYPFMQIWSVRRMEIYKQKGSEEVMGKVFTYFCLLIISVGLVISVLSRDVIILMADPKFWDAWRMVPILVLAQVIFSFFQHLNLGLLIVQKTKYFAYIDITNGIINLILNYFLIKKYGVMGAALATLCSYSLRVIMVYILTIPFYKIHFEITRIVKLFASAFFIYALTGFVQASSPWTDFGLKLLLISTLPLILLVIRFFNDQEITTIKLTACNLPAFWHRKRSKLNRMKPT